jgi:outer membrane protein assembly factor BamB
MLPSRKTPYILMTLIFIFSSMVSLSSSEDSVEDPWFAYGKSYTHSSGSSYNTTNNMGRIKWKVDLGFNIWASPVLDKNDNTYVGTENNTFFSISNIGEIRWTFLTLGRIMGGATVFDDKLFFGSTDGYLYCLSIDGKLIWKFKTGSWIDTTPIVDDEGSILFGGGDGFFYKLKEDGKQNRIQHWMMRKMSTLGRMVIK